LAIPIMKVNTNTDIEKIEIQMLKNKKLVEVIEHKINQYICGSADAKRTILAVYLFGSVLDNEKYKHNSDIDLAFLVKKIVRGIEFI
jgi:predicted nucleotidyltransferase